MTEPRSWLDLRKQDFDADEPLTLFDRPDCSHEPRPPDRLGDQFETPDLFATLEGDSDGS